MTRYTMWMQKSEPADCGTIAACSGETEALTAKNGEADDSGAPGTPLHNVTVTITASSSERGLHIQSIAGQPGLVKWGSGTWTLRLFVTTSNTNIRWNKMYVCRVSSACGSVATIGSATGLGITMSPAGGYSTTVSGGASTADPTDMIYLVFNFRNVAGSNQSVTLRLDRQQDTPLGIAQNITGSAAGDAAASALLTRLRRVTCSAAGTGVAMAVCQIAVDVVADFAARAVRATIAAAQAVLPDVLVRAVRASIPEGGGVGSSPIATTVHPELVEVGGVGPTQDAIARAVRAHLDELEGVGSTPTGEPVASKKPDAEGVGADVTPDSAGSSIPEAEGG